MTRTVEAPFRLGRLVSARRGRDDIEAWLCVCATVYSWFQARDDRQTPGCARNLL